MIDNPSKITLRIYGKSHREPVFIEPMDDNAIDISAALALRESTLDLRPVLEQDPERESDPTVRSSRSLPEAADPGR